MGKQTVLVVMMVLLGCTMAYAEYHQSDMPWPITGEMQAKADAAGVSVIGNGPAPKGAPSGNYVSPAVALGLAPSGKTGTAAAPANLPSLIDPEKAPYVTPAAPASRAAGVAMVKPLAFDGKNGHKITTDVPLWTTGPVEKPTSDDAPYIGTIQEGGSAGSQDQQKQGFSF